MKTLDWKPVIKSLLEKLVASGYTIASISHDDEFVTDPTFSEALNEIASCDESNLFVGTSGPHHRRRLWLRIILGNAPCETVADFTVDPELEKTVIEWSDSWEGRECPEQGAPPFNITEADLPAPTVAAVLADPSVSFALKDTLRAWLDRDALDAYNDAALLVELLRARAEVQPKEDAHTTGLRLAVQDAACILNELKAGNPQRTRAVYWLENNASLLA